LTSLVLSLLLAAAPGCPAALARARVLTDPDLCQEAVALVRALEGEGAGGPVFALLEEALLAESAQGAARSGAGLRFRAALGLHCALAARPPLPAAGPADRARAERILDGPAYRRARADPRVLRLRLLSLWRRLLDLLETGEAERYAFFSRAVFLGAAAAAALFGLIALRRRRPAPSPPPTPSPGQRSPSPDPSLAPALSAAGRGDAASAVRLSLLAALSALERAGEVPSGRTLTNGELVERLRGADPYRRDALHALSRLFDRTVYGERPAGPAEAEAALAAARVVLARGTR